MRQRVEQLVGEDCRQVWLSTFHSLCARLLAPGGAGHRAVSRLRHLRLVRPARRRQAGAEGARHRRQAASAARGAQSRISQAKNRMETPAAMRTAGWSLRDQQIGRVFERTARAHRRRRARFRRSAAEDGRARRDARARPRALRAQVPLRAGRRVPGHEPPAVPARQAPGRSPSQSLRRRRSRSVDLSLARRGPAQHPGLRAGLSRRARSSSSSRTIARRR